MVHRSNDRRYSEIPLFKILMFLVAFVPLIFPSPEQHPSEKRPESWARPVTLGGVPNLHKVTDTLYRSAQPTAAGMENLKGLGIKTIVNLRSFHSDRDEMGHIALEYEHIFMKAWHPEEKEVIRFLKIVTDSKRAPVLVHCQHGADRTGTMCALYRVTVQGWSRTEALKEMSEGGFGFHRVWTNLPKWIEKMDIRAIQTAVGLPAPENSIQE